jgi:hypothetical protein
MVAFVSDLKAVCFLKEVHNRQLKRIRTTFKKSSIWAKSDDSCLTSLGFGFPIHAILIPQ